MTKLKTISVLLAIGLMWVGGYLLAHAGDSPTTENRPTSSTTVAGDSTTTVSHQVVAYYFHGNVRCATCRKIEAYTKEAIDSAFTSDLMNGSVKWLVINVDSSQNKHFINDFQLYTRSVILSDLHKGQQKRWKNLDQVWTLAGNKAEFVKYIQSEVKAYLDTTR